jgi:hypothetical protein
MTELTVIRGYVGIMNAFPTPDLTSVKENPEKTCRNVLPGARVC